MAIPPQPSDVGDEAAVEEPNAALCNVVSAIEALGSSGTSSSLITRAIAKRFNALQRSTGARDCSLSEKGDACPVFDRGAPTRAVTCAKKERMTPCIR